MRWGMRFIGLISTIILARLLIPEDFGIIAMAMIVIGLLETIAYTGVDLALIRDQKLSKEHYNTAWTIQLLQGILVACLLVIIAPLAAAYFAEPRATLVIQLLALRALLESTKNIGIVAFRKELNFAKEFRFGIYTKLIQFVIVVSAALLFRNYWALVIGMIASAVIEVSLSYIMHPYRPWFCFTKIKEIWSFSQWLLISRIGFFLNKKTDQVIIGGAIGTSAMGQYHVSFSVSTMPTSELIMPMRRALFPTLAKILDAPAAFRTATLRTFATVAILCCSLGFGFMAIAEHFVVIFLGSQWLEAIPLVQWLALLGAFSAMTLSLEVVLWVTGKTLLSAIQTWLELLVLIPVLTYATYTFGIEGAALARAGVAILFLPFMFYLVTRVCTVSFADLLAALWRPLIAGLVMLAGLIWSPYDFAEQHLLALISKIALGGFLYLTTLLLLWTAAGRPAGIEAETLKLCRKYMPIQVG